MRSVQQEHLLRNQKIQQQHIHTHTFFLRQRIQRWNDQFAREMILLYVYAGCVRATRAGTWEFMIVILFMISETWNFKCNSRSSVGSSEKAFFIWSTRSSHGLCQERKKSFSVWPFLFGLHVQVYHGCMKKYVYSLRWNYLKLDRRSRGGSFWTLPYSLYFRLPKSRIR